MAVKAAEQSGEVAELTSVMHLDDFLNVMHDRIYSALGQMHVESLSAFAAAKKASGVIKQTEAKWHQDYDDWMDEIPH